MANDFFKNGDKAYSENLNDGLLVGNAFDWTVDISLPSDTGSVFPNSSTIVKAKMADVSITPNSNLSIGSTIENNSSSSQVYRLTVYPNFNRFGGFKSISLTADSGVTFYIANKGGTSPIASNLDYSDLSSVLELKVLKEYDIVVTIPNGGEVNGLSFIFQSSSADVSGSISQSNVSGLNDRLNNIEGTVNDLFDLVYPVGSIYMSVNSTSPQTLFGGTWEQLKDKFLLSAGNTYNAGDTGGSADATLVSHNHGTNTSGEYFVTSEKSESNDTKVSYNASGNRLVDGMTDTSTSSFHHRIDTDYVGSSGTGKNMPPYLVVYMWKRTA